MDDAETMVEMPKMMQVRVARPISKVRRAKNDPPSQPKRRLMPD
jgi:hypothetical protein